MNDPSHAPQSTVMNADQLLCCALDVAVLTAKCGGEIYRIEETVTRICRSYGAAHVEVNAITSLVDATVRMPDGSLTTQMRRIQSSDNDLGQLERCNALSRRICAELPSFAEIQAEVKSIKARGKAPLWQDLLGAMLTVGGFAIFFGGTAYDGLAAMVVGALMALLNRYAMPFANHFARTLLMSLLGSILSFFAVSIGFGNNMDKIMIGTIMLVIPGLALGTALRDLLSDDTLSGVLRLSRSLLIAVTIALGYTAGILLCGGENAFHYDQNTLPWLLSMSAIGPLGVGLMYRVKPSRLLPIVIGGLLSISIYRLCILQLDGEFFPNLIATVAVGFYARILAARFKFPTPVVSTPAIMPLLPGGLLFYCMQHMMVGQLEQALDFGVKTISVALGIAAGEVTVSLVHMAIYSLKKKKK